MKSKGVEMKGTKMNCVEFDRYIIDEKTALVFALQSFECTNCSASGLGYFNMSLVKDDKLIEAYCPFCDEKALEITTYRN